ncbi:uncharacterized protein LOC142525905 [Primulina tabacum]|uniref:uncharacterized protein LOC142525905 n=1 Tax=Primulina tabacum TaxID=48773 RepID=UPI003F59A9FE
MGKVIIASFSAQPCLQETIKLRQNQDPILTKLKEQVKEKKSQDLHIDEKGVLWMKGRLCVPHIENLRQEVMSEHINQNFGPPRAVQDVQRFKEKFLVELNEEGCSRYISRCQVCQQLKMNINGLEDFFKTLGNSKWKIGTYFHGFVVGLPKSRQSHNGI